MTVNGVEIFQILMIKLRKKNQILMKLQFLLRLFIEQIYILFIQYDLIKYCFYSNHLETILAN
jgi:hypothetical protein